MLRASIYLLCLISVVVFYVHSNLMAAQDNDFTSAIDAKQPLPHLLGPSPINRARINQLNVGTGAALLFPWQMSQVGAAAFKNADKIYVVFDQEQWFDLPNMQNSAKESGYFEKIEQLDARKGFSLFVITLGKKNTSDGFALSKQGDNWVLRPLGARLKTAEPFRVIAMPFAAPLPRVEIVTSKKADKRLYIKNSQLGKIVVIPSATPEEVNLRRYKFIDFDILESIQGVVMEVRADALSITNKDNRLLIESNGGLNIASKLYAGKERMQKEDDDWQGVVYAQSILKFRHFLTNEKGPTFSSQLAKLKHDLYTAFNDEKIIAYSELATFYVANGFYLEALSTIKELRDSNEQVYQDSYRLRLLEVVAQFMQHNYYDAFLLMNKIDIINSDLKWRKELRFWQAATKNMLLSNYALKNGDGTAAELFLNSSKNFLATYPIEIWFSLGLAIMREQSGETAKPLQNTMLRVAQLAKDGENPKTRISSKIVNRLYAQLGKYYWQNNMLEQALDNFNKCAEDITDIFNRTYCRFNIVQMQYASNSLKLDDALEEMQKLTTLWRGDELELEMQKYLAELYLDKKDYEKALECWDVIARNFPNTPDSLRFAGEIGKILSKVFAEQKENNITPFKALTMFYRFQDYVPFGEMGDDLIIHVAHNFIALDLLEQAENLLRHQVDNRLTGTRREEVINLLAYILLLDKKYNDALDVIGGGERYEHLPNRIAFQRKYIHARALVASGNEKEAIHMLDGDYSQDADEILQDIYWRHHQWQDFSKVSEPYVYPLRASKEKLSEVDAKKIAKQAIAYIMQGDIDLFHDMQEDVKARMPKQSHYTDIMNQIATFVVNCEDKSCNYGMLNIAELQKVIGDIAGGI